MWDSRLVAPTTPSSFLEDCNTGTTAKLNSDLLDEEFYEAIDLAFNPPKEGKHEENVPVYTTAPANHDSKDIVIRKRYEDHSQRKCADQSSLQFVASSHTQQGVEKFRSFTPLQYKSFGSPMFSVNNNGREPMEDWLSCLEKMFAAQPCSPVEQWGQCDSFDVKGKLHHSIVNSTKQGQALSWSSRDFLLEPRPLGEMVKAESSVNNCWS
jgi:hypothetical protein